MDIGSFGDFGRDPFSDEPSFPTKLAADGQFFKALSLRILANCMVNGNVSALAAGIKLYSRLKEGREERVPFVDAHKNSTADELAAIFAEPAKVVDLVREVESEAEKAQHATYLSSASNAVMWLAGTFGLDDEEAAIVTILAQLRYNPRLRHFVDRTIGTYPDIRTRRGWTPVFAVAATGGFDQETLRVALGPKGFLASKGMAISSGGSNVGQMVVRFSDFMETILVSPEGTRRDDFERIMLGISDEKARFSLADFPQVGETSSVAMLLRNCLRDGAGEKGVNILLCGPSGSGKTEFARSLAEAVEARLCRAGSVDVSEMSGGMTRRDGAHAEDRLARFLMARTLALRLGRVVLLVEDAEEVFSAVPWKAGVEELMDGNDVVTIWVVEDSRSLPKHAVRRMLDVVEFGRPSKAVRTDIARRLVSEADLGWDDDAVARLVELDVPASLMERGVRAASLSTGKVDKAVSVVEAIGRRLGDRKPPKPIRSRFSYDLSLVRADVDLAGLADRIAGGGRRAVSFCFYGMPGTGKTAFANHLAGRLDMPLLERRGSDLLGKYVGESEEKIAEAFETARNLEAFLVINEADSFLQDRRYARQNWESGIVNEMLTWMESHPLPFAMSTNLMERLDPASLRRFLFKIRFRDMAPDQVEAAFLNAFGVAAPPGFGGTPLLTPGDFALVCRQVEVLGTTDASEIAAMLADEVAMKISYDPAMRAAAAGPVVDVGP